MLPVILKINIWVFNLLEKSGVLNDPDLFPFLLEAQEIVEDSNRWHCVVVHRNESPHLKPLGGIIPVDDRNREPVCPVNEHDVQLLRTYEPTWQSHVRAFRYIMDMLCQTDFPAIGADPGDLFPAGSDAGVPGLGHSKDNRSLTKTGLKRGHARFQRVKKKAWRIRVHRPTRQTALVFMKPWVVPDKTFNHREMPPFRVFDMESSLIP